VNRPDLRALALIVLLTAPGAAADISLRNCAVVIDAGEPSYVRFTVEELRRQVKAGTGASPDLYYDLNDAKRQPGTLVVVGRAMAGRLAQDISGAPRITDKEPGPQGFVLKTLQPTASNRPVVLAAGSDSVGTNYALMQLRQLLIESPSGLSMSAAQDLNEKPDYQVRGLYLHQHWRYNNPYAAWSWSVEDWKHALDVAAYLRVNLVLLWPHMDMMAPPLDVAERDYLADLREVVDYARRKRGLEVWMVEGPNVLFDAEAVKRLPLDSRDYYAYAHIAGRDGHTYKAGPALKNPGDPREFEALMANREALYRLVPNADGYGYIDEDPGGYSGSPASEFVDLYEGNRKLLDRYHDRPREAKLFYWISGSWGNGTEEENLRGTLRDFDNRVKPPWELLFYPEFTQIIRELKYSDQGILFPYGIIEGEPSFPLTNITFHAIGKTDYSGLKGVMANVQTLLVQLPNIFYLIRSAWSSQLRNADEATVLRTLARLVYPEQADLLAQGWAQLTKSGSEAAMAVAVRIQDLLGHGQMGRLGTIGASLFPTSNQVFRDLVTMLRIHGKAERVQEQVAASASREEVTRALVEYFREMLDWQNTNGFFGAYGVNKQVIWDRFIHGAESDSMVVKRAWEQYAKGRDDPQKLQAGIVRTLCTAGYTGWIVNSMTGQIFGTYRVKSESTMDIP